MRLLRLLVPVYIILSVLTFSVPAAQDIQKPEEQVKTIKIGLLVPDSNSLSARHGAEIAIREANEKGGFKGKPFQLVVRSMEGPWGTGSKAAVSLIYDENVCSIIGSTDGRNAHLVEQVTTKARIVFLSTWATDPTLSQAFVPWYFSCVPNDLQQADALIKEIYTKRKIDRIAAVSDNSYDSKLAVESFLKKTKSAGKKDPIQLFYDNPNQDFDVLINQVRNAGVDGIIIFGKPSASARLIHQLRQRKMNQSLFGALSLLDEDNISDQDLKSYENVVLVSSGTMSGSKSLTFREEFRKTYGRLPGMVAAYSFDGMSLLIEAIRSAGTDHENIQKALAKLHFEGATGPIQFDDKGKRAGVPSLIEIKNGVPVDIGIRDNPGKN